MHDSTTVAIFAKAPIPGFAKTRLIPILGAEGAAVMQAKLITHALEVARAAQLGPVSLWCTPNCDHPYFASLIADGNLEIYQQSPGDLGVKMHHAFDVLCTQGPTLLMGTDCLVIEPRHLRQCADELRHGADAAFMPVEDGGYILAGLRQPTPELFRDIPWNTDAVMQTTRNRAKDANLHIVEPATLWDIDRPEDYTRAIRAGLLPANAS